MRASLLVLPDRRETKLIPGSVGSGAAATHYLGALPFYADGTIRNINTLPDLLPECGAVHTYDGLLILPTVSEYTFSRARPGQAACKSGIIIPEQLRTEKQWLLSSGCGLTDFCRNDGSFTSPHDTGLPVLIFDRIATFRAVRRLSTAADEVQTTLDQLMVELAGAGEATIVAANFEEIVVVELTFSLRPEQELRSAPTGAGTRKLRSTRVQRANRAAE